MERYLATMGHNQTDPINHGLVSVTDDGYIGDTPVEDFGMYILREEPFPPTGSDELFQIFMDLIREREEPSNEPDESMDGDFDSGMASAGLGTDEDYEHGSPIMEEF